MERKELGFILRYEIRHNGYNIFFNEIPLHDSRHSTHKINVLA
jgi:hypothetical protein